VRLRRVSFSTGGDPVAEAVKAFAQGRARTATEMFTTKARRTRKGDQRTGDQ